MIKTARMASRTESPKGYKGGTVKQGFFSAFRMRNILARQSDQASAARGWQRCCGGYSWAHHRLLTRGSAARPLPVRLIVAAVAASYGIAGLAMPAVAWATTAHTEHSSKPSPNSKKSAVVASKPRQLAQAQSIGAAPVAKVVQHGPSSTSLQHAAQAWTDMPSGLKDAYAAHGWKPFWLTGAADQASRLASLLSAFEQADRHGVLLPALAGNLNDSPELYELSLSRSAAILARALSHGALQSPAEDAERPVPPSDKAILEQISQNTAPGDAILARAPHTLLYRNTLKALEESRKIAATASWPKIPSEGKLTPGDDAAEVPLLRQRLLASGAYHADEATLASTIYDEPLQAAVKAFQDAHGLEPDGVVGRSTRDALNVSPALRVDQLRVNLDRLRWLPDGLSDRYLLVNIAGFEAWLFNKDTVEMSTPVIVGKDQQRTPSFSNSIKSVEFNPSWEVPRSIALKEILPRQAKDHSYLAKENMEVYDGWENGGQLVNPDTVDWASLAKAERLPYRFRQKPGPKNSLGRVKLLFPNSYDVYLHDTPSRGLFNRRVRAFSHGCMRVGKPLELSAVVLGMPLERVNEIIDGGKQLRVKVANPLPIHITYLTSWADPISGQIRYGSDVYGRDAALVAQLHPAGKTSDTDPDPAIAKAGAGLAVQAPTPSSVSSPSVQAPATPAPAVLLPAAASVGDQAAPAAPVGPNGEAAKPEPVGTEPTPQGPDKADPSKDTPQPARPEAQPEAPPKKDDKAAQDAPLSPVLAQGTISTQTDATAKKPE